VELVDLCREDEVTLRQTVDLMRPGRVLYCSPGKEDVWVMPLLLSKLTYPQYRVDRFIERTHAVVALRMRTVEPVDGAVAPANKAVGTRGDVEGRRRSPVAFPSRFVRESILSTRAARERFGYGFVTP
jgi:hypothetical protein